jgi:hypothetical protein
MTHGVCSECQWSTIASQMGHPPGLICRLDPPRMMVLPAQQGGIMFQALFPAVARDEWCSHFSKDPATRS